MLCLIATIIDVLSLPSVFYDYYKQLLYDVCQCGVVWINLEMDNAKNCRLCLSGICGNDFVLVENYISHMLEDLCMQVNMQISDDPIICNECAMNLQNFFDFKWNFLSMKNSERNSAPDFKVVYSNETKDVANDVSAEQEICRFCAIIAPKYEFLQLYDRKENIFIIPMLQKHILGLNLNIFENLVACNSCFELLKSFYAFVTKCIDVEEELIKYIDIEGTDNSGHIKLNDIAKLTCNNDTVRVKDIYDQCGEYSTFIKMENKNLLEEDTFPSTIKTKEIDLKEEATDGASQDTIHQNPITKLYECNICSYAVKLKMHIYQHLLGHKSPSEVTMYSCAKCSFTTKYKRWMRRHNIVHKNPMVSPILKCELCSYETKRRCNLNRHLLTHKSLSEVPLLECDRCSYKTKYKDCFMKHMKLYTRPANLPIFKCDLCSYETTRRCNLTKHMVGHKSLEDVPFLECDKCSYKTRHKSNITRHMFVHKDPSELTIHKCQNCPYETRYKRCMQRHSLVHKNPAEVSKFKCDLCPYATRMPSNLKRHKLTRHKLSEETIFLECEKCSYKTKHRDDLRKHIRVHKD